MELTQIVEALIFAAPQPITVSEMQKAVKRAASESDDPAAEVLTAVTPKKVEKAIEDLSEYYFNTGRPTELIETATGWRFVTREEYAEYIRALLPELKPEKLSAPALETLALVAYRQPITKADIEAVRGVSVDGVINKLLDRDLIKVGGRADLPGRPQLYETTPLFMEHFDIKDLNELPNAAELQTVDLPTAEEEEETEELAETEQPDEAEKEEVAENEEGNIVDADSEEAESEEEVDESQIDDEEDDSTESDENPESEEIDTDEPGATETED
ncbi:MAG: SMC-Scp complex subunit ScpB [Verrucomicrobiota bacterium]